ncbi:MAG: NAD(P)/FAD-dependent oxidoreductase, partial [Myxococcales bacterium]|nr:NAD(P)/FAD-dependent oxidoreductase [Myxococcales bacterium]
LDAEIVIVGAGFSGLGMAIALKRAGLDSFVVLEKGTEIGGTWRDNTYPGCACDVPSHLYSYSFYPNPNWSRRYAGHEEILNYLRATTEHYDIPRHIRFGCEVTGLRFDSDTASWQIDIEGQGSMRTRYVILGVGALHRPLIPNIDGLDTFDGHCFHSANWRHDIDLTGRNVAVIGTGASAIQFVPKLAEQVGHLYLFQRTPPWILPKPDGEIRSFERRLYATIPGLRLLYRTLLYTLHETKGLAFGFNTRLMKLAELAGRAHIRRTVRDRELRRKLTPNYTPGCKRVLLSNDYYPSLNRPNVEVVTTPIEAIGSDHIRLVGGERVHTDAIVLGTGFRVTEPLPRGMVFGSGGLDLWATWKDGISAYKGTLVSGFPNLFMLTGPNTGLGHNSMIVMIEAQIGFILGVIERARAKGWSTVDVRAGAQTAYNRALGPRLEKSVWGSGCNSWYLDENGSNPTIWPGLASEFWLKMKRFERGAFDVSA